MDIGIVGLDTSHSESFAELFADRDDANLVAVWDGGDVRDDAFVAEFCEQYGATRYDDPASMVDAVDTAMVLSVNWDDHAEQAEPFLSAGVPTFVDKPVAGRLADVEAIADAAADGTLFGGSAIPFHPYLEAFPRGHAGRTLFCSGYNDPFYYGVHLVDTVRTLAGASWTAATPVDGPGTVVAVDFENDARATLRLDLPHENKAFAFLDVADDTRTATLPVGERRDEMYSNFLDAYFASVRGDRDESARIVDGASLLLAVSAAVESGETVTPGDDALRTFHADGDAFREEYAAARS